ncbi:phage tail assembly protein [Streptomyces sp. DT117]|uniref:phage tail assembly protein n=1 Tax=Streptomyces sp. DT117 TaxID=3393422 RepID=UPI003CF1CCF7
MATYSLDSIRDAAEARYGSTNIEVGDKTVRLLNPLRLSKEKRTALSSLQDSMGGEGADQEALLADAIRLVAESDGRADLLLKAVDGDLAVMAEIFDAYGKGTQVGEASASQS